MAKKNKTVWGEYAVWDERNTEFLNNRIYDSLGAAKKEAADELENATDPDEVEEGDDVFIIYKLVKVGTYIADVEHKIIPNWSGCDE